MLEYTQDFLNNNHGDPALPVVRPKDNQSKPLLWLQENRPKLDELILEHGGILLRGFNIHSLSEFNQFCMTYAPNLLEYEFRSTPRSTLGGRIYTSTEYPKEKTIPQHNENAYTNKWPDILLLFSVVVADKGGETPVGNSRKILKALPEDLVERFEKHGVMYVRNYQEGIDLSWQEVFQTDNKEDMDKYCQDNNIEYEWLNDGNQLRTKQILQATTIHPVTGGKVWFNQANLFHVSALGEDGKLLIDQLGVENLPRNAYFGDGSEIDISLINEINAVIEQEKFFFAWQKGDILLIDNLLMNHGRNPFEGSRKVAVAMANVWKQV
jgi:alpha-ketoglutarate-dependent taurine dioxygenase